MKGLKKVLSIILTITMFVSIVPLTVNAANTKDATILFEGRGTSSEPYIIRTADDLIRLSSLVGSGNSFSKSYFVQDSDIVFDSSIENNLTPIGNEENCFSGHYDGNNYTIYGININLPETSYIGLFGYASGSISNLNIDSSTMIGNGNVGAIVGCGRGLSLSNITVKSNVAVTGTCNVAGVVGCTNGYNARCYIAYCHNYSSVIGVDNVGGINGSFYYGGLSYCSNQGSVSGDTEVGGIVGVLGGSLSNCYNGGVICGTCETGGVIGEIDTLNTGACNIDTCYNIGVIDCDTAYGSIIGGTRRSGSPYWGQYSREYPNTLYGTILAEPEHGYTSEYMKSEDFLISLGDAYTSDTINKNNGFPILKAEIPKPDITFSTDVWSFENPADKLDISHGKVLWPNVSNKEFEKIVESSGGGLCFGMTSTAIQMNSIISFNNSMMLLHSPSDYGALSVSKIQEQNISNMFGIKAIDMIKIMQFSQYSSVVCAEKKNNENDLQALYSAVSAYSNGNGLGVNIIINGRYFGNSSHSIWGVKVEDHSNYSDIIVYDCNYPNEERKLRLYKDKNGTFTSWSYRLVDGVLGIGTTDWGTGKRNSKISFTTKSEVAFLDVYNNLTGENYMDTISKNSLYDWDNTEYSLLCINKGNTDVNNLLKIESCNTLLQPEREGDPESDEFVVESPDLYWVKDNKVVVSSDENIDVELFAGTETIYLKTFSDSDSVLSVDESGVLCANVNTSPGQQVEIEFHSEKNGIDSNIIVSGVSYANDVLVKNDNNTLIVNGFEDITISSRNESEQHSKKYDNLEGVEITVNTNDIVEEYNFTLKLQNPSRTEIRNKDGIVLHANVDGTAPSGSYVKWESSNNNFDTSADGSNLKIIAKNKGWTTFTAILCDADGNELARDSVEMYSKSGFFDKIGGFFRGLFGLTKIYEN